MSTPNSVYSDDRTPSSSSSAASGASLQVNKSRQDYSDYLPLTQRVQADLRDDAEALRAQEGWDNETWDGVEEWVEDMDSIFRALRRNRYDERKTHSFLLASLQQRLTLSLHLPLPAFPPYTDSPLFFILPLPKHTDKLGRPIAVLTVREVVRDEEGSLDDMKEWAWWALEMVRRTLGDYWVKDIWSDHMFGEKGEGRGKGPGQGGEGMVLIVEAAGAGYRNMEVELLPTLLSVGHNNFPGMIEAVYVVNAGWTHRSMWGIVKRVLPKSALEKVMFLDTPQAIEQVFQRDTLPKVYGGSDSYTFSPSNNPIYNYYSRHSSFDNPTRPPSRNSSTASIADIYYSAPNTPARSRRNSSAVNLVGAGAGAGSIGGWRFGSALRMTKSRDEPCESRNAMVGNSHENEHEDGEGHIDPSDETHHGPAVDILSPTPLDEVPSSLAGIDVPTRTQSRRISSRETTPRGTSAIPTRSTATSTSALASATASASSSAIQRIKSLSDFHLYLSPSRLANIDLLSDSDDEGCEQSSSPEVSPRFRSDALASARGSAHPRENSKEVEGGEGRSGDRSSSNTNATTPLRRTLRPVIYEPEPSLHERRARPPLRLLEKGKEEANVRSYSDRLQAHHARGLQRYAGAGAKAGTGTPSRLGLGNVVTGDAGDGEQTGGRAVHGTNENRVASEQNGDTSHGRSGRNSEEEDGSFSPSSSTPGGLEPPSLGEHYTSSDQSGSDTRPITPPDLSKAVQTQGDGTHQSRVDSYSNSNPWFGYPVIHIPDPSGRGEGSLRPRYHRNRKRDLVKTLLFLLMLRVQSMRAYLERLLNVVLNKVTMDLWSRSGLGFSQGGKYPSRIGPSEGLLQSSSSSIDPSGAGVNNRSTGKGRTMFSNTGNMNGHDTTLGRQKWDRDWWWMIIGFLLLRGTGTWERIVVAPLEAVGWGKEVLGL